MLVKVMLKGARDSYELIVKVHVWLLKNPSKMALRCMHGFIRSYTRFKTAGRFNWENRFL